MRIPLTTRLLHAWNQKGRHDTVCPGLQFQFRIILAANPENSDWNVLLVMPWLDSRLLAIIVNHIPFIVMWSFKKNLNNKKNVIQQ